MEKSVKTIDIVEEKCEECCFFKDNMCRFNPPVVVVGPTVVFSRFPNVQKDDWCGKFKLARAT